MSRTPLIVTFLVILSGCSGGSGEPAGQKDSGADLNADVFLPTDTGAGDLLLRDTADATGVDIADIAAPDTTADADAGDAISAWGWISVIEPNDTCDQWYLKTQWFGGVRAYFATEPSFNRALPHTLGFAKVVAEAGACKLYDTGIMNDACLQTCMCLDKGVECYANNETERWCGQDEVCVDNPEIPPEQFDQGMCVPLPPHFDVGTITLGGLKSLIFMGPDEYDRYLATDLANPNDLFEMGDHITATTSGGDLPPLAFSARGVAPLTLASQTVLWRTGISPVVRWTPADVQSRIQIVLAAGSHDPNPLGGAIVCDVPDSDGQVEIASTLLDGLFYFTCNGQWLMKCSRITRYSRDLQKLGGKDIELFVGSARNLQLLRE